MSVDGAPPRVSVVLTAYNRQALLAESVGSVVGQQSERWELVIVDDGSDPPLSIPERASGHDAVRLIRQEPNQGPSAARNAGVRAGTGELVTSLDADDLPEPSSVAAIGVAFQRGVQR